MKTFLSLATALLIFFGGNEITQTCHDRLAKGRNYVTMGDEQKGLDTLKEYIESCHAEWESWRAFASLKGAIQRLAESDESLYLSHREWLLKVLYYNLDTLYYCADVTSIVHTLYRNGERGYDVNGMLSVYKYLIDENKCSDYTQAALAGWESARDQQRDLWEDTVTNPELTPFDTAFVSLEELGLGKLRGQQGAVENEPKGVSRGLLAVSASSNPFTDETKLFFTLESKELVTLTVHTTLGEEVHSRVAVFPPGDHEIKLDGRGLPVGTLYARLKTLDGEVKTIKLIHQ